MKCGARRVSLVRVDGIDPDPPQKPETTVLYKIPARFERINTNKKPESTIFLAILARFCDHIMAFWDLVTHYDLQHIEFSLVLIRTVVASTYPNRCYTN
jgi:hypothetical protein